ncbi:hypothetical protein DPMN_146870 [Dreissena polymorpha]|uniref:Uncharacterized protein n=1 Tax=Dreissena polymorpha TaxID=45954 RepID=A0A9D4F7W6_DREPO|nr:hypothetical protein DPMN_146870 [Dreissena polymorpha]
MTFQNCFQKVGSQWCSIRIVPQVTHLNRPLSFLRRKKVNFIDRGDGMPKSPNATPMDFGIWGILKRRLQKRNINSVIGLK